MMPCLPVMWPCSEFGDVFDVEKFIRTLRDDIRIVTELPADMQELPVYEMAPRSWSEVWLVQIALAARPHAVSFESAAALAIAM